MTSLNRALAQLAPYAPLVLRLVIGGLFVLHGVDKFSTGLSNVEGFFDSNGVPLAGVAAPLTAVAEIILGAALIAGLATRVAALALASIMVGAIIWVKNDAILGGAELDLAYLAGLVAIAFIGAGPASADRLLGTDGQVVDLRAATTEQRSTSSVKV